MRRKLDEAGVFGGAPGIAAERKGRIGESGTLRAKIGDALAGAADEYLPLDGIGEGDDAGRVRMARPQPGFLQEQ